MRIFWAVLIVAIAGAGFLIFSGGDDSSHTPAIQTATPTPQPNLKPTGDEAARSAEVAAPTPQTAEETITEATAEELELLNLANDVENPAPAPVVEETKAEITEAATDISEETTDEVAIDEEQEGDELEIVKLTADDIAEALSEAATPAPAETETANEAPSGWEALAANAKENGETEAPAAESLEIKHLEDGNLQVGSFTITGKGTKEAPYALPWDFLVSIREHYSPRDDKKTIPDHLAYFEGKYIEIAGYLQFPLAAPEPTECLVMLNQWDGCCIGVPPTPYDAIEVALSTPATQAQKFAVEGRIVGKLDIDPYLVGNWLIGLYLLGDATVDVSGARTAEELYGNTPAQLQPGQ